MKIKTCCSLSPDDVHGESQGFLHTVRLTLVGRKDRGWFSFIKQWKTHTLIQFTLTMILCVHLGQLYGFIQLVQGALQVRQLLGRETCASNRRKKQGRFPGKMGGFTPETDIMFHLKCLTVIPTSVNHTSFSHLSNWMKYCFVKRQKLSVNQPLTPAMKVIYYTYSTYSM